MLLFQPFFPECHLRLDFQDVTGNAVRERNDEPLISVARRHYFGQWMFDLARDAAGSVSKRACRTLLEPFHQPKPPPKQIAEDTNA